jgi:hypothetical protein
MSNKTSNKINMDEIDEQLVVSSVRKDRIAVREITPPPMAPLPAVVPVQQAQTGQLEKAPENETFVSPSEPPREETRSKRAGVQEYEALFIRETDLPPARFGKSVYIRKEYHDQISQIISVIGGNDVSLFGYIDNVLAHHLESYRDEIVRSFKKKTIFK